MNASEFVLVFVLVYVAKIKSETITNTAKRFGFKYSKYLIIFYTYAYFCYRHMLF